MTMPNFGPNDVMNSLWGGNRKQVPNPAGGMMPDDAILMYAGARHEHYPWTHLPTGGWYAWDMRGVLFTFTQDFMRFRSLSEVANFDTTIEHGFYDWLLFVASKLAKA